MPVKKVTPRVKKALLPSPIVTETETLVDLSLESKVVPMMAIIASVAMLMAFGSIIAAAAINIFNTNDSSQVFALGQCSDGDNYNVAIDESKLYPSSDFKVARGSMPIANMRNFDPYKASTAICRDTAKVVSYKDSCYMDKTGPLGRVGAQVASCAPTDKMCRVKEALYYPINSTSSSSTRYAIGSWNYLCKNGCMAGACLKDVTTTTPACTDSDVDSDGKSDPFKAGTVIDTLNGIATTNNDGCYYANQLTEFSCNNNKVISTTINCDVDCLDGACIRPSSYSISYPVIGANSISNRNLSSGVMTISSFWINAAGGNISWNGINFKYTLTNPSTTISRCLLYDTINSRAIGSTPTITNSDIFIKPSNEQIINKSITNMYELRCSIDGVIKSGDSLAVKIDGNFSSSSVATSYNQLFNGGEKRFLWSDMSNNKHSFNSNDWFGSGRLKELPTQTWTLVK